MSLRQRLEQKQIQKLILTQTLKQSIELLLYSQEELLQRLEEEAKTNPFLKVKKRNYIPRFFDSFIDYEATEKKYKAIENIAAKGVSLYSHLLSQLNELKLSEKEEEAARILITSLDKNGFLTINPESILSHLGLNSEEILQLRKKIASLDPVGCGALDFFESMIFQLEQRNVPEAKEAIYLLQNFRAEIENQDFNTIKQKTGYSDEKLKAIFSLLRTLNPFPGREYSNDETIYIEPDVYVFTEPIFEDGKVIDYKLDVVLNEKVHQNIELQKEYYKQLQKDPQIDKSKKEELRKKFHQAQFLMYAIEQRNQTLLKVAQSIVEHQKEFILTGSNLRPLKLKDIAEKLNIHESTVSRVTTNKYIYTKQGVFELKSFFKRGLKQLHRDHPISVDKVKEYIKEIIQNEDKQIPLKDKEIAELLLRKGIRIARRTVTKYRKELNLPPANQRVKI
ncbi:MAG: RNA polymerase factor sigma-54 [Leptospiraceae bacterium]|nr:RNA polymerase factor sigma-54 [Leptospiraceae bacterium]MDW7976406.1 RNA polymerase factor sigma-54 [Leptospiraceae bacterium]